jgi:hypothetical protein
VNWNTLTSSSPYSSFANGAAVVWGNAIIMAGNNQIIGILKL